MQYHMKKDLLFYWLCGAASVMAGAAITGGMDFGAGGDLFTIVITLVVSFLLICFGGLLWMVGAARMGAEE